MDVYTGATFSGGGGGGVGSCPNIFFRPASVVKLAQRGGGGGAESGMVS